jgi:hypothetical protein
MAKSNVAGVPAAPVLSWRVHLARRQPLRAAAAIFLIIGASAAAYLIWVHPLAAAAAGFLMLSAVAEFLLPITYRVGPDGAWCRSFLSLRHLQWAEVKRCYRDADGIKLSPLGRRSRLEAYRGIYLWLGDDGAAVVQAVRAYVKEAAP